MRKIKHGKLAAGCADSCCLKLEGLSVQLQGERILQDVSFHLHCGEIAALIGPNGAGKSSLFRCILGQMPYQGKITFSPARGPAIPLSAPLTGYVPQAPSFDRGDPVSVLDFFTAAIFGAASGYLVGLIAIPQCAVFLALFYMSKSLMPLMSAGMIGDFKAVGGIITLALGLKLSGIRHYDAINLLPAIILVFFISHLWSLLPF